MGSPCEAERTDSFLSTLKPDLDNASGGKVRVYHFKTTDLNQAGSFFILKHVLPCREVHR